MRNTCTHNKETQLPQKQQKQQQSQSHIVHRTGGEVETTPRVADGLTRQPAAETGAIVKADGECYHTDIARQRESVSGAMNAKTVHDTTHTNTHTARAFTHL